MHNNTLIKFGYPQSLVKAYDHWYLLCRPAQVTLGSLILISKSAATAFSALSHESFLEFEKIVKAIEKNLKTLFNYDKINYLMLMMVDPEVHFHIFPRYAKSQYFANYNFVDKGWPLKPDLENSNDVSKEVHQALVEHLTKSFS